MTSVRSRMGEVPTASAQQVEGEGNLLRLGPATMQGAARGLGCEARKCLRSEVRHALADPLVHGGGDGHCLGRRAPQVLEQDSR